MQKVLIGMAALSISMASGFAAAATTARGNYDASAAAPVSFTLGRGLRALAARTAPSSSGYPSVYEPHTGTMRFLWAGTDAQPAAVGALTRQALAEARARNFLTRQSPLLGLSAADVASAKLTEIHDLGHGPVIARFQQMANGLPVFGRRLNVMMDRAGSLHATSGYFATDLDRDAAASASFALSAPQAIVAAFADMGGSLKSAALTLSTHRGDYDWYALPANLRGYVLTRQPRSKQVMFPVGSSLVPAYYVELFASKGGANSDAYAYVISAADGSVLFRNNLKAFDATSYRVFADADGIHQPFDSPLGNGYDPFTGSAPDDVLPRTGATANLITLDHGPISTNDPWLPSGATTTTGNNVDAFLDTGLILGLQQTYIATDGYQPGTGDVRAAPSAANTYDYPATADDDPSSANGQQSAIVNLFYMNNWLHDFWYDHGFNEVAGNAQTSNYGRGGSEGDAISAQGQDASGRDNSNMATPADGSSPTQQMYLFDGTIAGEVRETAPTDSGKLVFTGASFGPTTFDVTAEAALANDQIGSSTSDGCGAALPIALLPTVPGIPDPTLSGKIALIDRGTCNFTTKELYATLSGAAALVVINNADGAPILMGNADVPTLPINVPISTDTVYTVPAVMITKAAGDALKAALSGGAKVTMHVQRLKSTDYDGTFDEQIIAHEFFHYVSNRLVNDGSGLGNQQGGGMGEGWSDFDALLLTIRPEDTLVPGNDQYQGAYALAYYATPGIVPVGYFYYGIRRMPYSKDMTKNSLTFEDIQDGTPLKTTAPVSFGADGAMNSEVHNTGEVWAEMLFECYTEILNNGEHDFESARSNMMDYIIGGLKMTPTSPTILEARDGVLAAAKASDFGDFAACSRGFAKRGAGVGAIGPASNSTDNVGVTESYDSGVDGGGTSGGTTGGTSGGTTGGTSTGGTTGGTSTGGTSGGTTGGTSGGTTGGTSTGGTSGGTSTGGTTGGSSGGTTGGTSGGSSGGTTGGGSTGGTSTGGSTSGTTGGTSTGGTTSGSTGGATTGGDTSTGSSTGGSSGGSTGSTTAGGSSTGGSSTGGSSSGGSGGGGAMSWELMLACAAFVGLRHRRRRLPSPEAAKVR